MIGIVIAAALVTVSDGHDVGVFQYYPSQPVTVSVAHECEYDTASFANVNFYDPYGTNICDGRADGWYTDTMTFYTSGKFLSLNGGPVYDETTPDANGDFVMYLLPQMFGNIRTRMLAMLFCGINPSGAVGCASSHSLEIQINFDDHFVGRPTITPIPLPAAAWLFLAGFIGLRQWGRRAVG